MEIWVLKMFFIVSVSAQFRKNIKYAYVERADTWSSARKYCRDHYIDLAPITSQGQELKLKNSTVGKVERFWIGLYRNGSHWQWSGGGRATYTPWAKNEPDRYAYQNVVSVCWDGCKSNGWHNDPNSMLFPFLCFGLIVVEHKATWEEAIWHCRQTHSTLTSLTSETEHLLALNKIQRDNITERLWIGLRYLVDHWQWVDGSRLVYEAWHQEGDQIHQCPRWKRCGALSKSGLWESWDCQEKLYFICY